MIKKKPTRKNVHLSRRNDAKRIKHVQKTKRVIDN